MNDIFSKNGVSMGRMQSLAKVVREGTITLAAKGDANAQSQISGDIKELEEVLGVNLLDRIKKPYPPTVAAQRLADAYGRFVREVEEVSIEAQGLRRPITVGAGEVVIRELLIPWIGKQRKGSAANTWVMRNLTWRKIQEGLSTELLDVGIADRLEASANVEVIDIESYGFKLVLPEHEKPDKSGWIRLTDLPVVVLDGAGRFRKFLADCEREHGVILKIGAECTTYPQVVDLAEATGSAVFVPEYWWKRHKEWAARTQALPGLEKLKRTLQLGWNRKVADRRPEVAKLVKALGGMK